MCVARLEGEKQEKVGLERGASPDWRVKSKNQSDEREDNYLTRRVESNEVGINLTEIPIFSLGIENFFSDVWQ